MLEDITLYEFNSLDECEQFEALWEFGELVSHRFEPGLKFLLYQISNFYVVLKYNDETNAIIGLRSFASTNNLDEFISHIDLSELR